MMAVNVYLWASLKKFTNDKDIFEFPIKIIFINKMFLNLKF